MTKPKPRKHKTKTPTPVEQGPLTKKARDYRRGKGTFEQLHELLAPFLQQELRKRRPLPRGVDADDLLQMTLLRIWKSFHQFRDDDTTRLSKWATTIAASVCAEAGRKSAKALAQLAEEQLGPSDDTHGPSTRAEIRDLASKIEGCFSVLTEDEETIFRLRVLEDVALIDIAARLGKPDGTVRSSFFRATQKLAQATRHIKDDDHGEPDAGVPSR